MRATYSLRKFIGAVLAASVAVCSGSSDVSAQAATILLRHSPSSLLALSTPRGWSNSFDSDSASTGNVIVSASQGVYVYSKTLKLLAQINVGEYFGRPLGLALDAAGDLYVANGGTNGIPVYKNDYKTLLATLSDPNGSQGIAVAQNGVVAAIAAYPPSVTFYASGTTTPCASLALPSVHGLSQGTFDAVGNFYITGQDPNYNAIAGVIRGGCSATGLTVLSTTNSLGEYVYRIQVSRFGKIVLGEQDNNTIYTYNPPVNGVLGKPIATTVLAANTSAIYQFGFTAKGAFVFVAENSGIVGKFAYPAGGSSLQSFGQKQQLDHPIGLVVAPPRTVILSRVPPTSR